MDGAAGTGNEFRISMEEEKNEAIKEYHINNLVKEIERIDAIPYGKGI